MYLTVVVYGTGLVNLLQLLGQQLVLVFEVLDLGSVTFLGA